MLRLVGLWTEAADVDAFDREYLGSHFPQVQGLVGARSATTCRCIDGPYFRMTEVVFNSLDDIHEAFEETAGKQLMEDANTPALKYGIQLDVLVVAEAN